MNELETTIQPIRQELKKIRGFVAPVTDRESCKLQADNLKAVKIKIKEIEEKRTELVRPINETVKKLNLIFKPIIEEFELLRDEIAKNILTFQRAEIERQQEEEKKLREAELKRLSDEQIRLEAEAAKNKSYAQHEEAEKIEEKIIAIENTPSYVKKCVKSDFAHTEVRENWSFEVMDESIVPRELCTPDSVKIRAAIKRGERQIPGLKIFDKGSVATY